MPDTIAALSRTSEPGSASPSYPGLPAAGQVQQPGLAHRTRRLLALVAWAAVLAAVALHLLQLGVVAPHRVDTGVLGRWPHAFHLWVVETGLVVLALLALLLRAGLPGWAARWPQASALTQALVLFGSLLGVQALLLSAFWLTRWQGVPELGWLRGAFWLGGEYRFPALFSALQLALAAALCWHCHRLDPRRTWVAAALICAYMAADELLSLHEAVGALVAPAEGPVPNGQRTHVKGVYDWLLVFVPLAALIALAMARGMARALRPVQFMLLVAAGATFVAGAVGFELAEAANAARQGSDAWWTSHQGHVNLLREEGLEMLGVALAVLVFAWRAFELRKQRSGGGR